MCTKNINALGVIILFMTALIGQCQSGKRKLKQAKSVYYEIDDTSSDSEEDKGRNSKDLAAKIILNLEDTEKSWNDEKIIRDGHRNEDMAHKLNLKDTKESIREDDVVRGDIESKFNERVPSTHEDLAAETRLNFKETQEPIREDDIEKADTKIKLNVPVVPKHGENPDVDEKVLTIHLTNKQSNQNQDHKPILRQWSPPPVIIGAQAEKLSNSKNAVSQQSSSEDDEAMQRDIKKVKALRHAYGSACVRVVERKCLWALKATLKQICKLGGKKCQRDFKNEFKANGMTACKMQFNNNSRFRMGNKGSMETGVQFRDSARTLSMTCLRALSDTTTEETQIGVKSEIVDAETKNVNILRDRYEKACKKESYLKCLAAGQYVTDTTCTKHICTDVKTKAIKISYKRFCKQYYGYEKSDSSLSSSISSDSSSTIESSSSSDSSGESGEKVEEYHKIFKDLIKHN